jgi:tRNA threonylcarbamoyl adenosine modification protein YeaZ
VPDLQSLTLAIDSGSPVVSIALGRQSEILAEVSFPGGPGSPSLLAKISELLSSVDARIQDVDSVIAARGPGSFTGLRSGLATVIGLQQALGTRATAVPSFQPLAEQAPTTGTTVAAIDALRGEWFVQSFGPGESAKTSAPRIVPPSALRSSAPCTVVAFGSAPLREELGELASIDVFEATPLAPWLLRVAARGDVGWDAATLVAPLYLRPPAARSGL